MIEANEKITLLRQVEFFQGMDADELQLIAQEMTERSYTDGDVLFREGDPGDRFFLLLSGTMQVYVERHGNIITYSQLEAGEFFGEMALIESTPRTATVRAESPSVCLTLSRDNFMDLLQRKPHIVLRMIRDLLPRLRRTNAQVQDYASRLADIGEESTAMMNFTEYDIGGFYDEMLEADGSPRSGSALLAQRVASLREGELLQHQRAAEQAMLQLGITFNVYGDESGAEKIFPFDVLPRIVEASDWA